MSKIVEIASKEIGYKEEPANSNDTKYGSWFGYDGVPWCGMFVSWVYTMAGFPLGNIGFFRGFAGCQTAVAFFKKTSRLTKNPVAGDIVFFDWNGDGRFDHTGIFVKKIDDEYFETIEGNTSTTNQSNGGMVMRRKRKYEGVLFVHPEKKDLYINKGNDFQIWLKSLGYTREGITHGAWLKDGNLVAGKELSDKLNEWKELFGQCDKEEI